MPQRVFQHSPALRTGLGRGTGCGFAGGVAFGGVALQAVIAAAGTVVFRHALAAAGGVGDGCAFAPAMPQRVGVVRHKGAAAARAQVERGAARFAACGGHSGLVVMGQRGSHVCDLAVAANGTLPDGIAGGGTGGSDRIGLIAVFAFGGVGGLYPAAAGADFKELAAVLTGGVPHNNALPAMA